VKDYGEFMTGIREQVGTNKKIFLQNNFDNFVEKK